MAYIGKTPTPAALTASDITDGIITSAKIADGTIATADIADSAVTLAKTSGVGGDLSFGGDTFGADKVIGSNDNYALSIETNGTERLKFTNDGRGLSQFTAKAWISFDGTGTVSINDSHNVSSLTDNGTGDYTVNFSNNLANGNYCAVANGRENNGTGGHFAQVPHVDTPTTSGFRLGLFNATFALRNAYHCMAVAFGD